MSVKRVIQLIQKRNKEASEAQFMWDILVYLDLPRAFEHLLQAAEDLMHQVVGGIPYVFLQSENNRTEGKKMLPF